MPAKVGVKVHVASPELRLLASVHEVGKVKGFPPRVALKFTVPPLSVGDTVAVTVSGDPTVAEPEKLTKC